MTRGRWLVGGLIGAGALVVAAEALPAYVAGRLVVGVVAVFVLVGVLAVGLASLARARRYIDRELGALRADPPGGALYLERRRQALELRRRNVAPDLDVLADATAAEEAERGYTGKYLVATTVLIGLVGTFGGLMETLARVAPALKGDLSSTGPAGALGLIAGPLAGLHVTFGTSVVAIMVTLALALVQGDVALHHERLLALLQERTRHVLLPELWPADESAGERAVRALIDLRAFVAETLAVNAEASAAKVAAVVRVEVQRLVEQVGGEMRAAGLAQAGALERTSAATTDGLRQVTELAAKELRSAATTSREAMTAAASASREAIGSAAAASREAMTVAASTIEATARQSDVRAREDAERVAGAVATAVAEAVAGMGAAAAQTSASFTAATTEAIAALGAAAAQTSASFTAATTDAVTGMAAATARTSESFAGATAGAVAEVAAATARTSESFTTATAGTVAALADLRGSLGAQLEGASHALTTAAGDLHDAAQTLSPALAELGPQLGALTAEVALLAARADSPDQPSAILDELVRLGEDVERLITSSQAGAVAPPEPDPVPVQEPSA